MEKKWDIDGLKKVSFREVHFEQLNQNYLGFLFMNFIFNFEIVLEVFEVYSLEQQD